MKIAVDDIDEIEHVEGTLKFYIHYQKKASQSMLDGVLTTPKGSSGFGSMLKKKFTFSGGDDTEEPKEDCSEQFESKFVKQIIEAFNTVLEIIEQQESELNDWVGDDFAQIKAQNTKVNSQKQSKKSKISKALPKFTSLSSNKEQEAKKKEDQPGGNTKSKIVIDNYIDKVKPQDGPSKNTKPAPVIQKSPFKQEPQPAVEDDFEYGEYYDEEDDN